MVPVRRPGAGRTRPRPRGGGPADGYQSPERQQLALKLEQGIPADRAGPGDSRALRLFPDGSLQGLLGPRKDSGPQDPGNRIPKPDSRGTRIPARRPQAPRPGRPRPAGGRQPSVYQGETMKPVTLNTQTATGPGHRSPLPLFACLAGAGPAGTRGRAPRQASPRSSGCSPWSSRGTGLCRLDSTHPPRPRGGQGPGPGDPPPGDPPPGALPGLSPPGAATAGRRRSLAGRPSPLPPTPTRPTPLGLPQHSPPPRSTSPSSGSPSSARSLSLAGLDGHADSRKGSGAPGSGRPRLVFELPSRGPSSFLRGCGSAPAQPDIRGGHDLHRALPTLPIQVLDPGLVVPLALVSGLNLARDQPLGYLLTGLFLMKGITLGLAVGAMILWSALAGLPVNPRRPRSSRRSSGRG
ncbi:MAG: hypothetical protein MZV70_69460 [Desulfobacterales bacterium]|nr:hypothetical protein [Desulfobacterales bacterium]